MLRDGRTDIKLLYIIDDCMDTEMNRTVNIYLCARKTYKKVILMCYIARTYRLAIKFFQYVVETD